MCVLIVEDDAFIRETFADYLSSRGLPVVVAHDGDMAVALIENPPRRFSVLLTDFHMPGSLHGCEVADHMKAHHPHVHVFIITGRPDVLAEACGADFNYEVIRKPCGLEHLHTRIANLVDHRFEI